MWLWITNISDDTIETKLQQYCRFLFVCCLLFLLFYFKQLKLEHICFNEDCGNIETSVTDYIFKLRLKPCVIYRYLKESWIFLAAHMEKFKKKNVNEPGPCRVLASNYLM